MGRWGVRVRGALDASRAWLSARPYGWALLASVLLAALLGVVLTLAVDAAHDVCDHHHTGSLHACNRESGGG